MKIVSVNNGQQQNFRGILIKTSGIVWKGTENGIPTTYKKEYDYSPFAD